MSSSANRASATSAYEKSYFEQQREILLGEIAVSFEHVLSSINKLNRSLEGVIAVGNEFSSVEALWSQFENVMAKDASSSSSTPENAETGSGSGQQTELGSSIKREEMGEGEGEGEGEETTMM